MQMDGEPWRQPIPAAPDAVRRRPTGLQESGRSTTVAGGGGGPGQQPPAAAAHQVVVRVSHCGQSLMLFNEKDPQGIRRTRNIAARGAKCSSPVASHFSFLQRPDLDGQASVGRQ